ncbi:MAG: hypothetical protein AAB935_00245 [Patescibacteria group bacterium]
MKPSTKRVLSIGLSGLFLIAVLIVYGNFIRPELVRIDKKRAAVLSKEALFNNQKTAVLGVQKLISQFQSVSRLQETVSLAMPLDENVTQALNQLQAIGKNSQASVVSFAINPLSFEPTREPLVKRLGVLETDLVLQGSYESLKSFLKYLETNVRVANVKNFRIGPGSSQSQDFYSLVLKAEMYYQE